MSRLLYEDEIKVVASIINELQYLQARIQSFNKSAEIETLPYVSQVTVLHRPGPNTEVYGVFGYESGQWFYDPQS